MSTDQQPPLSILIVDDVTSAREILKDMVSELGFSAIYEATDGQEARNLLATKEIDVVLCDQVMKDMSGRELLVHIRQDLKKTGLPVIFVSALSSVADVEETMDLSATDYIVKPPSFRKLRRKIEDALYATGRRVELEAQPIV